MFSSAARKIEPVYSNVDQIPQYYDEGTGPVLFEDFAREMAHRVTAVQPKRVLELAAGTGILSRRLRDSLPVDTEIVITDINPPMLDVARSKFRQGENIFFDQIDAARIGFPPDSFDLIVCQFGFNYFYDKTRAFSEVRRVLEPGGTFLFNTWGTMAQNPYAQIVQNSLARFFHPNAAPIFFGQRFSYCDPFEVMADMSSGGFDNVDYENRDLQKHVTDMGAFARGLIQGDPLIDEIRRLPGVFEADVVAAVESDLRAAFPTGLMPLRSIMFEGWA